MPEPLDPRSIIEEAEQAAAAGDYASAEELLREAAFLQEATLGSSHPELANTLKNLGVMCEVLDKPVDAERSFRRAVAIATAALPPDHPFVITSRENLRDFYEAREQQVEVPISSPAVAAKLDAPATTAALDPSWATTPLIPPPATQPLTPPPESQLRAESEILPPVVQTPSMRPLAIGVSIAFALLLIIFFTARPWLTDRAESSSAIDLESTPEVSTPPRESEKPIALRQDTAKTVASVAGSGRSRMAEDPTSTRPTVVRARLCAELDEWLCDPPDRPIPPGPLFFYTQVKSSRATTVQHRWYQGSRVYKTVELRVQGSPSGYRTFSRHILNRDNSGSWRVEVRAADGALLHEERFSVR